MTTSTTLRAARLITAIAAGAAVLGSVSCSAPASPPATSSASAPASPPASSAAEVASTPAPGSKTIEYDGVQVDVPVTWQRLDMSGCEFRFERWAAPASPPCDFAQGLSFYGSATFDPKNGPGVRREATTWAGWVYAGDYAVYLSADNRAFVQKVLDSARTT